jgi:hypothetical protein
MSKAQIVEAVKELDARRQAQIQRQIDSINRLLASIENGESHRQRYEHELMRLNEQLALMDVRLGMKTEVLRRIKQSCRDRAVMPGGDHAAKILAMIEEVMPDARSDDVDSGRPTADDDSIIGLGG